MKLKFLLSALFVLAFSAFAFATNTIQDPDTTTAADIVTWATPFVVLAVTWLVRVAKPIIPGWATMFVVTGISAAVTWASTLLDNPDLSWIQQFGFGLLSVFLHQLYKQFTAKE